MGTLENPDAGQGPVLLDIGDDVGALVVAMPESTDGLEVEIRPVGATARAAGHHGEHHAHDHHRHRHHHAHVAVVARQDRDRIAHTLVYPAVAAGEHELVPLPDGRVVLTVTVEGGAVTRATWPPD